MPNVINVVKGTTSFTVPMFVYDSSSNIGAGLGSITYNFTSFLLYLKKTTDASWTAITKATMTAGTWAASGWVESDATHALGWYEFGVPNTWLTTVGQVMINAYGGANMLPAKVILNVYDPGTLQTGDAYAVVTNASYGNAYLVRSTTPANTLTVDTSHGALQSVGTGTGQINLSSGAVPLQAGTGTGQLDFTSGVVKSSMVQILGSTITGTAANIVGAFTKFFDKATPTGTINSLPDAVAGATNGLFIAGTNAATTVTTALTTTFTGNLTGNVGGSVASVAAAGINNAAFAADVGSTAYATNIIALAVRKVLDILNLDHLLAVATGGTDMTTEVVDGSVVSRIISNSDTSLFVPGISNLTTIAAQGSSGIKKNTALPGFQFLMVLSSDHVTGATGKTVTATRSLDGGAFGACANAVSELTNGAYKIDLAAADDNGDIGMLRFSASGCDDTWIEFKTTS